MQTLTPAFCKLYYRSKYGIDTSCVLKCLHADNSIVVRKTVNGQYGTPSLRFYTNGKVERGVLMGGVSWQDAVIIDMVRK